MADSFDTNGMVSALNDVSNHQGAATTNGMDDLKRQEAHALARDRGWVEPQGFDYAQYNATGKEAAAAEALQGSGWAHSAVKYEWLEEYGDVGPVVPQLEEQLFRSEFRNRRGMRFDE